MKKLLSLLLCMTLLLGVIPAQAEMYVDTPFGETAFQITMIQYGTLHVMFDSSNDIWKYSLSQGPDDQGDVIRYTTPDKRFQAAFVSDSQGTGVEEIHILFDHTLLGPDSSYDAYLMAFSILAIPMILSDNPTYGDTFMQTLTDQFVDVQLYGTSSGPYQTSRKQVAPGIYMSCYRNGKDAAILLEFQPVATQDNLQLYVLAAASLLKDD